MTVDAALGEHGLICRHTRFSSQYFPDSLKSYGELWPSIIVGWRGEVLEAKVEYNTRFGQALMRLQRKSHISIALVSRPELFVEDGEMSFLAANQSRTRLVLHHNPTPFNVAIPLVPTMTE
jgi:hypothetical protein